MQDANWATEHCRQEASTEDFTHIVQSRIPTEKRLDQVLVSEHFTVHRCELWNGTWSASNGLGPSDHAPVVT